MEEIKALLQPKQTEKLLRSLVELRNRRDHAKLLHQLLPDVLNVVYGNTTDPLAWFLGSVMVPVEHLEHLLAPGDIIFNAVLEATSSNLVYALSLEKDSPLPGYACDALRKNFANGTYLLPAFSTRMKDRNTIELYMFEYYMLLFVRYLFSSRSSKSVSAKDTTFYFQLLQKYLDYFFPIRNAPWISQTTSNAKIVPSRISFLLFVAEYWLNNFDSFETYTIPLKTVCYGISKIITHFQLAGFTQDDDTRLFYPALFKFFYSAFTLWPSGDLDSLKSVVNVWLSFIQPWLLTKPVLEEHEHAEIVTKWTSFIKPFFPFYSFLLTAFIQFAAKFDMSKPEYLSLIEQVITVFYNEPLLGVLRILEDEFYKGGNTAAAQYARSRVTLLTEKTNASQNFAPLANSSSSALPSQVLSYSTYKGIPPIMHFSNDKKPHLLQPELAAHQNAIKVYALIEIAHSSKKRFDFSDLKNISVSRATRSFPSDFIRNNFDLSNPIVVSLLKFIDGEETPEEKKRRVRQSWKNAFDTIFAVIRFRSGSAKVGKSNQLLQKLHVVFSLSAREVRLRRQMLPEASLSEVFAEEPKSLLNEDGRWALTSVGKKQILSGAVTCSRSKVPFVGDEFDRPVCTHEFQILVKAAKIASKIVNSACDTNLSLRPLASWHTWIQLFIFYAVASTLLRLLF